MLSIITTPGRILFHEFCFLMYLVNVKLLRKELPQSRYEEIASKVLHVATGQPVPLGSKQECKGSGALSATPVSGRFC